MNKLKNIKKLNISIKSINFFVLMSFILKNSYFLCSSKAALLQKLEIIKQKNNDFKKNLQKSSSIATNAASNSGNLNIATHRATPNIVTPSNNNQLNNQSILPSVQQPIQQQILNNNASPSLPSGYIDQMLQKQVATLEEEKRKLQSENEALKKENENLKNNKKELENKNKEFEEKLKNQKTQIVNENKQNKQQTGSKNKINIKLSNLNKVVIEEIKNKINTAIKESDVEKIIELIINGIKRASSKANENILSLKEFEKLLQECKKKIEELKNNANYNQQILPPQLNILVNNITNTNNSATIIPPQLDILNSTNTNNTAEDAPILDILSNTNGAN